MSQSEKRDMEKPKVRFSQPSEDNSSNNSEKPDGYFDKSTFCKPRIRSIVTLQDPVKIIKKNADISTSSKKNTDVPSKSIDNAKTISEPLNSTSLDNTKKLSPSRNNSQTCIRQDNSNRVSPSKLGAAETATQSKIGTTSKAARICGSKITSRHVIPKTIVSIGKKTSKKLAPVTTNNAAPANASITKINRTKEKTSGRGLMPCLSRNVSTAKSNSCGLKISKPGSKSWRTRSKSSPVKKTVLRDVSSGATDVHVGPGVPRYYSQNFEINLEEEKPHIRPNIVDGEKLSRPEYNSIICTIDELRRVKSEKFVTDVEHLPLFYRNLVNEKVSAALDFPPDEAIYKNLVDLSVNENQLPTRLTRSRDPERRNRDIVPKLSDFFKPTYSEEYCSAVQIRPSSPEIFSNWSAFAISDKIFGWKHDMDQLN